MSILFDLTIEELIVLGTEIYCIDCRVLGLLEVVSDSSCI